MKEDFPENGNFIKDSLTLGIKFLDETTDLIAVVDNGFRYRFVNRAYAGIHSKTIEDFIGFHVKDFISGEVFNTIIKPNLEKTFAGERINYESAFEFGANGTRYMEVNYFPLNDNGNIFAAIVTRDVTRLKRSETTHKKSGEFFYKMINTIDDPVYVKDENLRYVIVNEKFCNFIDMKRSDITGKTDKDIFSREQASEFEGYDRNVLNTFEPLLSEHKIKIKSDIVTISTKKSLFVDSLSGQRFIVGTIRDISEHSKTAEILSYMATHDSLTDLPNRMLFYEYLKQQIFHSKRYSKMFALMVLDLDKFKEVNDNLGHSAGDKLLVDVVKRLKHILRKSDTLSRIGGDEFILLLPELNNIKEACNVAEKILSEIRKPYKLEGGEATISVSIGIAFYPDCGDDAEILIKNADTAMYCAKNNNRDNYFFFGMDVVTSPSDKE